MKDRILELARTYFFFGNPLEYEFDFFFKKLEEVYREAHQDGQRAMRERVAKLCDVVGEHENAFAIRNLEVE